MSPFLVTLCYGSALVVALVVLWYFGAKRWYWHVLSVLAALALGLVRLPEFWNQPVPTLIVGWVFTFLFLWGIAAPAIALRPHSPQFHPKAR